MTIECIDPEIRFRAKFTPGEPDECWPWTGALTSQGCGSFMLVTRKKWIAAPRFAWQLANGRPVPPGLVVMHACDYPACVNPAHLSLGTQADNLRDMRLKGRGHRSSFDLAQLQALRAAGLTYSQVGDIVGTTKPVIWRLVNGRDGKGPRKPRL